jgi:hypothetical protein
LKTQAPLTLVPYPNLVCRETELPLAMWQRGSISAPNLRRRA